MSSLEHNLDPKVIIVGGGPIGLAVAIELARFKVRSILFEQNAGTSTHPKTRNLATRTMEIAMGWGAATYGRLQSIDTSDDWKSPIRFLTSIVGDQLAEIRATGFLGPGPTVSPASPLMTSQDLVEEILRDDALATGLVDLRFGHRVQRVLSGTRETDSSTSVLVRDEAGVERTVTAHAIVAADGADSDIRRSLGVDLRGERDLAYLVNCYFRCDVERHVGERRGVLLFVNNKRARGVFQPLDGRGRWLCQIALPESEWRSERFTAEYCRSWIRAAVGSDDIDPEILSIGKWRMNASVASRFVVGRVVLVGDAAHQFPPTGGLGVNTGWQAAHNLSWKLAYAIRGDAGQDLVKTYEDERMPVALAIAEQSRHNHENARKIGKDAVRYGANSVDGADFKRQAARYGNHLGIELGPEYRSSAVIPDGTTVPAVADAYSEYAASGTPGCRAPHIWLGRRPGILSILNLFGPHLTLLTGSSQVGSWRAACVATGHATGLTIACYGIGEAGIEDPEGRFSDLYGTGPEGAVLVRPDGHIAWRTQNLPDDPSRTLRDVTDVILSRSGGPRPEPAVEIATEASR